MPPCPPLPEIQPHNEHTVAILEHPFPYLSVEMTRTPCNLLRNEKHPHFELLKTQKSFHTPLPDSTTDDEHNEPAANGPPAPPFSHRATFGPIQASGSCRSRPHVYRHVTRCWWPADILSRCLSMNQTSKGEPIQRSHQQCTSGIRSSSSLQAGARGARCAPTLYLCNQTLS